MSDKPAPSLVGRVFDLLGSMQVSVVLMLYLGVLTFAGTVAQIDLSAYDVQKVYFESWTAPLWGPIYGPGGLPVMAALGINLLVGGVLRQIGRAHV